MSGPGGWLGFGIPNPIGVLGGLLGGVLGSGGGGGILGDLFGGLGGLVQGWLASAAKSAYDELASLINNSAGSIKFSPQSWWGSKVAGTGELWPTVLSIAMAVLLACVLLAVIRGALSGDAGTALRSVGLEVPKAIFGMVTVVALTGVLSASVDSASALVLPGVGAGFGDWYVRSGAGLFFGSFVQLLALVGALLTWLELVVRQGLVFLLVALSPLILAARVWPAAAGVWRRFVELGVALIVSKFVIALALALGADALAGSVGSGSGPSLTAMATGAGLMLLAALSPFVLLRLMPGVEAAVAAAGITRMPIRTATSAVSMATSVALLSRLGMGAGSRLAASQSANVGGSARPASYGSTYPASASLAKVAALDVTSRPAIDRPADRGLPPGPGALPRPGGDPRTGGGDSSGGEEK